MTDFHQRQAISTLTAPAARGFAPHYLVQPDRLTPIDPATGTSIELSIGLYHKQPESQQEIWLDRKSEGSYHDIEVFTVTDAEMIQCAIDEGFANAAIVDTADIVFDYSFRPSCAENLCGQ